MTSRGVPLSAELGSVLWASLVFGAVAVAVGALSLGPPWPISVVLVALAVVADSGLRRRIASSDDPPTGDGSGTVGLETARGVSREVVVASSTSASADAPAVELPRGEGRARSERQCPECGRFDLDVAGRGDGYHFVCRDCSARWSWTAGEPWPRTSPRPWEGGPGEPRG